MQRVFAVAIGAGFLTLVGCGGGLETVPVTGQVKYQGQPAENAQVIFMPAAGRPATGITDAEGNFALSTLSDGDGAVPGLHTVTVGEYYGPGNAPPMPGMGEAIQSKFPSSYSNPQTSGLSADVAREGKNHFVFELE